MTKRGWLAFSLLSAIWGVPYLFIRIAVRGGVPPLVLAWVRVTMASVILLALAAQAGKLSGLRARWRAIVAYAVGAGPLSDPNVQSVVLNGKGMMPGFAGRFTQDQMNDLLSYLHTGLR